jgi:hypothetical protein
MVRLTFLGLLLLVCFGAAGCGGDEKGVNQNKEKPQPAAK